MGSTISTAYEVAIGTATNEEEVAECLREIAEDTANRLTDIASTAKAMLSRYEGSNILTPAGKVNSDQFSICGRLPQMLSLS